MTEHTKPPFTPWDAMVWLCWHRRGWQSDPDWDRTEYWWYDEEGNDVAVAEEGVSAIADGWTSWIAILENPTHQRTEFTGQDAAALIKFCKPQPSIWSARSILFD